MSFWKQAKDKAVLDRLLDEQIHALAAQEIQSGVRRDGLWAMATLQAEADESRAKIIYLKLLVTRLKDEYYISERQQDQSATYQPASDPKQAEVERERKQREQSIRAEAERERAQRAHIDAERKRTQLEQRAKIETERRGAQHNHAKARARANSPRDREKIDRLYALCQRLRTDDLAYDQYEVLAKAISGSLRQEKGNYIVTHGDTLATFNNIPALRPWFIEHVLPAIESTHGLTTHSTNRDFAQTLTPGNRHNSSESENDEEIRTNKKLKTNTTSAKPMLLVLGSLTAAIIATVLANSQSQFGSLSAPLDNATTASNLIVGAVGAALLLPAIHVGIASLWVPYRNSRSRRNIFFGWGVAITILQLIILFSK